MLEQVIQIIRGQLEEPGLALSAQTNLLTDLQLNSLELVELVCALEDAFELEVPGEGFAQIRHHRRCGELSRAPVNPAGRGGDIDADPAGLSADASAAAHLVHGKLHPGTGMWNNAGSLKMRGRLDFALLAEAVNRYIASHPNIRLRVTERDGQPVQYVAPYRPYPVERLDFSALGKQGLYDWDSQQNTAPMPLMDCDLFYFAIFQTGEGGGRHLRQGAPHHLRRAEHDRPDQRDHADLSGPAGGDRAGDCARAGLSVVHRSGGGLSGFAPGPARPGLLAAGARPAAGAHPHEGGQVQGDLGARPAQNLRAHRPGQRADPRSTASAPSCRPSACFCRCWRCTSTG